MVRVFRVSGIHVRIELNAVSARKAARRPVDATSAINIERVSDRKTYIKRSRGGEEKEKERKGGRRSL